MGLKKQRRMGMLVGCGAAAVAASAVSAGRSSGAVTLFNSNGFEASAGYVSGVALDNDQPSTAASQNQFSGGFGGTGAVPVAGIDTYGSFFGGTSTQQFALMISTGTNSTTGGIAEYYPNTNVVAPYVASGSANPVVDVVFTLAVTKATAGEPLFGVIAANSAGSEIGELLVDASNGNVMGGTGGTAFTAAANTFYSYELQLNYTSQQVNMYEASPGSGAFTTLIGTSAFVTPSTDFALAAISSFSISPSASAGTAPGGQSGVFGAFDDYSVIATSVPEPTVVSLALGGVAVLAGRRRNRTAR